MSDLSPVAAARPLRAFTMQPRRAAGEPALCHARRGGSRPAALGCLLSGWLVLGASLPGAAAGQAPGFSEQLIAGGYGYTFGVAAHDLDGDGDLDLTSVDIVGKNPSAASLLWYENDGLGSFQRHVMHDQENGWLERHCVGDINGDGRPDVAVVSNRDGLLLWFAHPGGNARGRWRRHVISTNCPAAYDVALADLDGDGDLDAASAGYTSGTLAWYENRQGHEHGPPQGPAGQWPRRVVDAGLAENRTVRLGDVNGDGKIDLLAACVGASFAAAGEAVPAAEHGACVAWYENCLAASPPQEAGSGWKKHVIDERSRGAVHGHAVDLDQDGDLDVVLAFGMRPEHVPTDRHEVAWYENLGRPDDASGWQRHVVGPLACAFETVAADLDADGDLDLAATAWSLGDRVVWFESPGDPRGKWSMHVVRESFLAANQVIAADLNGDGRTDLAASADDGSRRVQGANELRWWRNEGR